MIGVLSLLTTMLPGRRASARDHAFEPGGQDLLVIGGVRRHENGIVAADIADDLGPARTVECQCDTLRRADGRAKDEQVWSGDQPTNSVVVST